MLDHHIYMYNYIEPHHSKKGRNRAPNRQQEQGKLKGKNCTVQQTNTITVSQTNLKSTST